MPGAPEISVVIPCFNAEKTIVRAVESVRGQGFLDWELLVVDDGSVDGSAELVEEISRGDSRVNLLRRGHGGVVAAANAGMRAARGKFIVRMDADDVSRKNRLERQRDFLLENGNCGMVSCLVDFAGNRESAGGYARHVDWANGQVTAGEIARTRFVDLPVPNPTLMMRREVFAEVGEFADGDFPEDYEWFLRSQEAGIKAGKVAQVLYDWHDPPGRLTRNDGRYSPTAFHRVKAPFLARAIAAAACGGRELWVWGAGRPARKWARFLEEAWKPASGFVDIDPRKIGQRIQGRPVVGVGDLPEKERAVIVSYVGTRGAGEVIRAELGNRGRVEGVDFWLAA